MATSPEIESHIGEERPFMSADDIRRLELSASGKLRWVSVDPKDKQGRHGSPKQTGALGQQINYGILPANFQGLTEEEIEQIEKLLNGNPFLMARDQKTLDEVWAEKMMEIRNDKRYTLSLIDTINRRLKHVENDKKNEMLKEREELQGIVDDNTREDRLNFQRVAYEIYRLNEMATKIRNKDQTFDINEAVRSGITMDEIEQRYAEANHD